MSKAPTPSDPAEGNAAETSGAGKRSRLKTLALGAGLTVLALGILGMGTFIAADRYTAQPNFCGTCHIMEPYYESWKADVHGRAGGLAACVDCHYAPGERSTFMAKFRGLSQATSYFSGRYGTGRPRAVIDNNSCLTSDCHGGREFMDKPLWISKSTQESGGGAVQTSAPAGAAGRSKPPTVTFFHSKHLEPDPAREAQRRARHEQLASRLSNALGAEAFAKLDDLAKRMGAAEERNDDIREYLKETAPERTDEALEYASLEHTLLRTAQLHNLTCSSCHTFAANGAHHITVEHTSCFTCHFANESFNSGTGQCLRCHTPPSGNIAVHGTGQAGAVMDHTTFVEKGVHCISCHADLVRGSGQVTRRDCTHCHDQERYLKDFESRTTATVKGYHEAHTFEQHAKCTDCHRTIHHELIQKGGEQADNFFKPVLDDCQHCHPSHHKEQVQLLMGVGGQGIDKPIPNPMFGSRVTCRACHTEKGSDFKGDVLVKATKKNCVACHSDTYDALYDEWINQLQTRFSEVERLGERARALAAKPPSQQTANASKAKDLMARAEENARLVQAAHGIHNRSYALELLDQAARDLHKAIELMTPPAPATSEGG